MLPRKTTRTCLALWVIASFRTEIKDGLERMWYRGSVPSRSEAGVKKVRSPNFLQGMLYGVPNYDTCASPDGPIPSSMPGDAPFSQGQNSYKRAITCPRGIQNLSGGVVLLVPCTSCDAAEIFAETPLLTRLPKAGFDVCWVNLPFHGLGDMQLSGEFVAYAVSHLANSSSSGKVNVVAYSQGGANAQWAITFWPSIRSQIINLVTIASPHKGTLFTDPMCKVLNVIGGCLTSVLQMSPNSRYNSAVFKRSIENGGQEALVPTTSIYTFGDQLVLPQVSNSNGASYLSGASNIALSEACGRNHIIEHFGIVYDMATYGLVYDALSHGRPASLESFDLLRKPFTRILMKVMTQSDKNLLRTSLKLPSHVRTLWRGLVGRPMDRLDRMKKVYTFSGLPSEPPLMPYVCEKGYAPQSHCSTIGFCQNRSNKTAIKTSRRNISAIARVYTTQIVLPSFSRWVVVVGKAADVTSGSYTHLLPS
ncbi:uncharacterized protein MELLADRAFT_96074 [Melampsora larici-populina 98AG31]|uniref:DUF676 domain-containing protein n=1 Tax=Melampsora larici-populina (strain 98AG31 / pathotype 3-4-7) TaxID=747676 RepID=F4SAV4_MELLP|nr:uncharacterized protein MELLADRAFT_96074 [Melampsora larici-populina 98AG31]EGF98232.1 hypothetical protein MELLADRAFT_96074 [Melampsora larici-populina 98AG31]